jgi:hypothetical protein
MFGRVASESCKMVEISCSAVQSSGSVLGSLSL